MLSLIETGKRRPSLRSWERIRQALGITLPLPEEAWRQPTREISDELVASLGACLATVRAARLAEFAEATGASISEVRLALRRLANQLQGAGIQVLDDGSHVQLTADSRFRAAVTHLRKPEQLPRLTREQAEVLAIVIFRRHATRRRIEEIRGAAQLSIGPEGPVSLPRDSSETLALLLSRGLLFATIVRWDVRWSTGPPPGCSNWWKWRRWRRPGDDLFAEGASRVETDPDPNTVSLSDIARQISFYGELLSFEREVLEGNVDPGGWSCLGH